MTDQRKPLWRLMSAAAYEATRKDGIPPAAHAAILRAIADEVDKMDISEGRIFSEFVNGFNYGADVTKKAVSRLLRDAADEADSKS